MTEIAVLPQGKRPALPRGHTLMFKVHRGKKGQRIATGGQVDKGDGVKDIVIGPRGKHPPLPKGHKLVFKVHRDKRGERIGTGGQANKGAGKGDAVPDRRMTIKPAWQPKERPVGGRKQRTAPRRTKSARAGPMPGRERASDCRFSKPRPEGQGRRGLAGFPKNFPRPPGLKSGWTLPTSEGMLYLLGVSGGPQSMVRFVKTALPARGWRITGTKTARNPGAKSDSVYVFFRNGDYCGWIAIGRGAPAPTYMNVLFKKHRGRVGGG